MAHIWNVPFDRYFSNDLKNILCFKGIPHPESRIETGGTPVAKGAGVDSDTFYLNGDKL